MEASGNCGPFKVQVGEFAVYRDLTGIPTENLRLDRQIYLLPNPLT